MIIKPQLMIIIIRYFMIFYSPTLWPSFITVLLQTDSEPWSKWSLYKVYIIYVTQLLTILLPNHVMLAKKQQPGHNLISLFFQTIKHH